MKWILWFAIAGAALSSLGCTNNLGGCASDIECRGGRLCVAGACKGGVSANNGSANNGSNNGLSNNGYSNNGWSNNGWSNNGWSNNGWSNNGWSNNGWSNNGWSNNGWSNNGWSNNGLVEQRDLRRSGTDLCSARRLRLGPRVRRVWKPGDRHVLWRMRARRLLLPGQHLSIRKLHQRRRYQHLDR